MQYHSFLKRTLALLTGGKNWYERKWVPGSLHGADTVS
jgi:hypothetical protein